MRLTIFLLGLCTALFFGCSEPQKKPAEVAATAPIQPTAVISQVDPPASSEKAQASMSELTCKRDPVTRVLKVESSQPKGCKLFYSNHSNKDPVASSHTASTHCEQVRDRIRAKLEEAGFKCDSKDAQ